MNKKSSNLPLQSKKTPIIIIKLPPDKPLNPLTSPYFPFLGSFWTDGAFEFNVDLEYDVNKPSLKKGFGANPEELFEIDYAVDNLWWLTLYTVTGSFSLGSYKSSITKKLLW